MRAFQLILFLLCYNELTAQPYFDLVNISFSNQKPAFLYKGKNELKTENNSGQINLNIPLKLNRQLLLLPTIGYEERNFRTENFQDTLTDQSNSGFNSSNKLRTQSFYFPLGFQCTLRDSSKKLSGAVIYRFNFIHPAKADWKNDMLGGALIYSKIKSERLILKAGIYYNREFYGNYFLPLIGAEWQASEKLFVWGLLPRAATVDYSFSKALHAGITYKGIEDSFDGNSNDSYFHFTEGQLKLFAELYLPGTAFVLRLEAGQTLLRNLEYAHKENGDEIKHDINPSETSILLAGISYRFITNKNFRTPVKPQH